MPKKFDKCIREKGRVRRVSGPSKRWKLKKNQYRNICWDKKNIPHLGEKHTKKIKKSISLLTDKVLLSIHYYLHQMKKGEQNKIVKHIHSIIVDELKNRKLKHYKRDNLDII